MRYLIITLLLIYTYSTSTSQNLSLLNYQTNAYKNVIGFKTDLGVGSSDVSWGFTKKLIQGGEISPELKDRAFTQLSDLNSGGGLWTIGLFYGKQSNNYFGIKNSEWRFGINHIEYADALFSKDYFGLVFFGNKKYENQAAKLDQLKYNYLSYSTIETGFIKTKHHFRFGMDLGLAIGHKSIEVVGNKGSIFTAQDGEFVDVDLDFTTSVTPNPFTSKSINGIGATSNFLLGFQLLNNGWIDFHIDRLGLVRWNENTIQSKLDTTTRIEGIEVQNLFDSIYINLKSFEAYQSEFIHKSNQSKTENLPLQLGISFTKVFWNDKLLFLGEVNYLPYSNVSPSYDLYLHLKLNSHFSVGASTGIGGYNTFRIGLASDILLNKSCLIQLYTRSFFWVIQEKNPTSFIAGASIRKYF